MPRLRVDHDLVALLQSLADLDHLLVVKPGNLLLPVAVAAVGADATAVLARIRVPVAGGVTWQHELRLLTPTATRAVTLTDLTVSRRPVLSASPDGRFIAVGGFTDDQCRL